MNSTDKAKQQLMESMRITKAGSASKIEEVDPNQNATSQDDKPVLAANKVAVKKRVAVKKKVATTKKVSGGTQQTVVDPYQIVRRVWPD